MEYIDSLNDELKEYFSILCNNDYPKFIDKYIMLPELQRLSKVGQFCGCDYTNIFNIKYWYSRLDHSIACALMAWHFSKDKIQTLMALFHDLGTPAFSHCIDYVMGDYTKQESSEKSVYDIILNSSDIISCLNSDGIDANVFGDFNKYTIIENKKPKLCVDRLDGVLHTCLIWTRYFEIDVIRRIYPHIVVLTNESNEKEIGFDDLNIANIFFDGVYKYSITLQENEDKFIMQFLSDYIKLSLHNNVISFNDLYELSEYEIISKISNTNKNAWEKFSNATSIIRTEESPNNCYYINIDVKKRFVMPLCISNNNVYRLDKISNLCRELTNKYLEFKDSKYAYIDGIKL